MNPHAPVMLDIAGTTLSKADVQRLRHPLAGGLILFARNFENRRQLTELTAAAKKARPDLLICVDHEGGRVQRFRTDGFTHLPAMQVLGEMWMKDPLTATDAASAAGFIEDLAITPGHRAADAQADGLGEGLLGTEAGGQVANAARRRALAAGVEDLQFFGAQHAFGKAIAAPLQHRSDAADVAQIGADAVDHGGAPAARMQR